MSKINSKLPHAVLTSSISHHTNSSVSGGHIMKLFHVATCLKKTDENRQSGYKKHGDCIVVVVVNQPKYHTENLQKRDNVNHRKKLLVMVCTSHLTQGHECRQVL